MDMETSIASLDSDLEFAGLTGSISNKEGLEQSLAKMMKCLFIRTHNLSKQVHIASTNCFVYKTTLINTI